MTRPPLSMSLAPLEPRTLLATTYTLLELPFAPLDLNNADQILTADSVYQIHPAGRLTQTLLPAITPSATLTARKFNDEGIVVATETLILPTDGTRSQQVLLGPNSHGVYQSRYLFDNTTPTDDQPNAPVVINNLGQILTSGGEDESLPDLTGDVRLFTLGRHGALTNESANGLLHGGTRTIDLPLDLNNIGQLITTDAHYPVDNFVTFRRGVATLQTAEQLAGGVPAPVQHLNALNDRAQIVGATQPPGPDQHLNATLYQLSRHNRYYRTFLGTLPTHNTSQALAINNPGQILGTSSITRSSGRTVDLTATLTQPDARGIYGPTQDLNALIPDPGKDRVTRPLAINDAGVILAEGISTRNSSRRFLLLLPSRANRTQPTTTTAPLSPASTRPTPSATRPIPFAATTLLESDPNLW